MGKKTIIISILLLILASISVNAVSGTKVSDSSSWFLGNVTFYDDIIMNNSNILSNNDIDITINNSKKIKVNDNGAIIFYGKNDISSDEGTSLNIFGLSGTTDWSGAKNRANINWWSGNEGWNDSNNRGLAITTHRSGDFGNSTDQPNQVTFYSALKHNSTGVTGKAFQWTWGEDTQGYLMLDSLNRLRFPEEYTGFYNNESGQVAGIDSDDEQFKLTLDRDGSSSTGHKFAITTDSGKEIPSYTHSSILFYLDSNNTRINTKNLSINDGEGINGSPRILLNGRAELGYNGSAYFKGLEGKELLLGSNNSDAIRIKNDKSVEFYGNVEIKNLTSNNINIKRTPYKVLSQDGSGDYDGSDFNTIQNAFNSVNNGGTLYIKSGNYIIGDNNLKIPSGNINIIGDGRSSVLSCSGNDYTSCISLLNNTPTNYINIKNIKIDHVDNGGNRTGLNLSYCQQCTTEKVGITDFNIGFTTGDKTTGSFYQNHEDMQIQSKGVDNIGILSNSIYNKFDNVRVSSVNGTGIWIQEHSNKLYGINVERDSKYGVRISSDDTLLSGGYFEANDINIQIDEDSEMTKIVSCFSGDGDLDINDSGIDSEIQLWDYDRYIKKQNGYKTIDVNFNDVLLPNTNGANLIYINNFNYPLLNFTNNTNSVIYYKTKLPNDINLDKNITLNLEQSLSENDYSETKYSYFNITVSFIKEGDYLNNLDIIEYNITDDLYADKYRVRKSNPNLEISTSHLLDIDDYSILLKLERNPNNIVDNSNQDILLSNIWMEYFSTTIYD